MGNLIIKHASLYYYYRYNNDYCSCSLTVSPDSAHSLVAMIVLKVSKGRAVQVYDYKTKDQTLELEVKGVT